MRSGKVHLCSMVVTPSLINLVIKAQGFDPKLAAALEYLVDDTLDQCPLSGMLVLMVV